MPGPTNESAPAPQPPSETNTPSPWDFLKKVFVPKDSVQPQKTPDQQTPGRKLNRRDFLYFLAMAGAGGVAAAAGNELVKTVKSFVPDIDPTAGTETGQTSQETPPPTQQPTETPPPTATPQAVNNTAKETVSLIETQTLFDDPETEEIAKRYGMTIDNLLIFPQEEEGKRFLGQLKAFTKPELLPVFPPSVLKHKEFIREISQKYNVPPNVIAGIMTIESCGIETAKSWAGAQGLFQVMPLHFSEADQANPARMQEKYNNAEKAMTYFSSCIKTAQDKMAQHGYPPNHPAVYARAMIAYNAGQGSIVKDFARLEDESKFYGDHFVRLLLMMEIADNLRQKNYSDPQIAQKMRSSEMDARCYAFQQFVLRNYSLKRWSYNLYQQALVIFQGKYPGLDDKTLVPMGTFDDEHQPYFENDAKENKVASGKLIWQDYENYKAKPTWSRPVSPGLRMWIAIGGSSLFEDDRLGGINVTAESWDNISSR